MKIYLIGMYNNPTVDSLVEMKSVIFAHFSTLGTWIDERRPCDSCEWHWQAIAPPLLVQWEPSSEVIGDFSWDGPFGYTFIAKEQVAKALECMDFECCFHPVEYIKPKRRRNTVPFPYHGPKLLWGVCMASVSLDMAESNVKIESSCTVCGDIIYTFKNRGIIIQNSLWHGQKMFRIKSNGRSNATFVTDEGRRLICESGHSNICFTEAGAIV